MYGIIALGIILFDELLPVYAELSKERGGLGLPRSTLGGILTMQGAVLLVFQLFFFSRICGWLGAKGLYLWATGLSIPLFLLFPLLPVLQGATEKAGGGWKTWVGAYLPFFLLKNIFTPSFFSTSFILINNAAKQQDLGRVNGVAQSCSSLLRALGPTAGGGVFSAALRWRALPLQSRPAIAFVLVAICMVGACYLGSTLPAWVDEDGGGSKARKATAGSEIEDEAGLQSKTASRPSSGDNGKTEETDSLVGSLGADRPTVAA